MIEQMDGKSNTTTLPSLMTRKGKTPGKRIFNAANILADFIPNTHTPSSVYRDTFPGIDERYVLPAGIGRRSCTTNTTFLYENPRFNNEPICFTDTKLTHAEQSKWHPKSIVPERKYFPEYKCDTISRSDYQIIIDRPLRGTRFGNNPQHQKYVQGIVPTNNNVDLLITKPRISFKHQYDCRQGRKESGKRLGSFVWGSRRNNAVHNINMNSSHAITAPS